MRKKNKHDTLLDIVEQEVKKNYLFTVRNVEYRNGYQGNCAGEIDLMGVSPARVDLYEMKSSDKEKNQEHAMSQLRRAKEYLQGVFCQPINCFYMTYDHEGGAVVKAIIPAGDLNGKEHTGYYTRTKRE